MRVKDTIEFLGLWEILNNPNFNRVQFDGFKMQAGSNEFWTISGDEQIQNMNKAIIEWFKISCEIKEIRKVERLIPDKVTIIDKKTEIEAILKNIILIMSMMIKKNVLLYGDINKPGFVKNNS